MWLHGPLLPSGADCSSGADCGVSMLGSDCARPPMPTGAAPHHVAAGAHGELDGQLFLDRHDLGELAVEGAVGDAEAAMADHRVQPVVAELGTERQGLDVVDTHVGARMRPLYITGRC